jgi:hypothetical protein
MILSTWASRTQDQPERSPGSPDIPWPELPTSLSRGKTIKDKSLSNICSFTFVTVVLLEILVPKI